MNESEEEIIQKEIARLREILRALKEKIPPLAEVLERQRLHNLQAHGRDVSEPLECDECWELAALYDLAARKENAKPLDCEVVR